ncbi:MAG: cyclic nucleotide-binding domain-containing protein [Candidatus Synoicihabitans palmerolidicus]|nr:cyclic nucleotide-binding domain-containing protein [Candidatus Synoicihabitans palmerolidicus]
MFAFARRALMQVFEVDQTLLRAHDDNQYFPLLYEGEFSVTQHTKEVARLKSGDFFGEISALQNSTATATITVRTPTQCFVVAKREFLQFLVNDFHVGLHFEKSAPIVSVLQFFLSRVARLTSSADRINASLWGSAVGN